MLRFFLICTGFFLAGAIMIETGKLIPWILVIFFGFGAVVIGISMIPGASYLELTREGFCVRSIFRRHFTPWRSVAAFRVGRLGNRGDAVFFDIADGQTRTKLQLANQRVCGCDGALTEYYGVDPHALAIMMNEWRERAAKSAHT